MLLLPSTALAAEPRSGNTVLVGPNEVIDDDLYVFGRTVTVEGTVTGDLVAFGGTIAVNGLVTGDLIAAAGEVRGSVRSAGGTVVITGSVGEDVLVGGGTMTVGPTAQVSPLTSISYCL